jgi:phosphoglucosamine mutase
MITASHNPEAYNGIKLFNPDGSSFTRSQQEELEVNLRKVQYGDWLHQGTLSTFAAVQPYITAIKQSVSLDKELQVVLDCGSGAGCTVSPQLLSELGVHAVCVNCHPSGHFPRPSEPVPENLLYIPGLMKKTGSKVAVVHDGDADRMMAFDENGRYIDGDHLLMLFATYLGINKIVTTVDASMAVEEIAEVRRTPVGDSFVSEELMTSLCPDGPYAAALLCEISGQWNIAETLDEMPHYPVLRESEHFDNSEEIMHSLGAGNPTDGIRLTFEDGWCLIRASGTEPKIRFTAEGKTLGTAKKILSHGREVVRRGKTA